MHVLFSKLLVVSDIAAVSAAVISVVVLRLVLRRSVGETTVGTMGAAYVNANNIGLPVAVYVLGDPTLVAPVLLFQLLVFTPAILIVMDSVTASGPKASRARAISRPFTNPLLIASLLGVVFAVAKVRIPDAVLQPFELVGAAAVPVVLISFGMSLTGQRPLRAGTGRADVVLASVLKLMMMPVVAWLLGAFVFHFDHEQLFVAVVLAALPSAQNVFNYAQRYETGVVVARDTVLVTTIAAVPVLVVIAALLK